MGDMVRIGSGGKEGHGRCHCTPFGKMTYRRAGYALARRAAWDGVARVTDDG